MHLSWFDIFLLVCAFGFVWGGYWSGLIQSIGGIVGLFVGQFIASRYYIQFADAVQPVFAGNAVVAKVFAFVLMFLFVTRVVGVIFWLVNKIFHMIAIVPGMKFVNRIGGAVFGLIEASLFIGITLQFLTRLPISAAFASTLKASAVAGYFLGVTGWLVPLFPSVIRQAQDATKLIPNIDINATMKTINAVQNSGLVK